MVSQLYDATFASTQKAGSDRKGWRKFPHITTPQCAHGSANLGFCQLNALSRPALHQREPAGRHDHATTSPSGYASARTLAPDFINGPMNKLTAYYFLHTAV